jgi:CRP-like cAMP-binding protein
VLYQAGAVPSTQQILLWGRVELSAPDGQSRFVEPPAPLALEETLRGRPAYETARTITPAVVLTLSMDELRTLLADNTDLVQGLFTMLLATPEGNEGAIMRVEGERLPASLPPALRPIDKIMLLQRLPMFRAVPAEEIIHLAAIAREVPLKQGEALFGEADPAACYLMISGEVALMATDQQPVASIARPGDAIGLYETLAGKPIGQAGHVEAEGRALRLDHDDLYDAIGLRPGLLQHLFGALFDARPVPVG